MSILTKVESAVVKFEHTKLGEQLFRVVRLTVVGVAAAAATGSTVDTALIVTAAEVAFRQVFPTKP